MERTSEQSRSGAGKWRVFAVLVLTALAPFLGGSVEVWAMGVLALGTGLLMLWQPVRQWPGRWFGLFLAGLLLVALSAFLPAGIFATPRWRTDLVALGAELGPFRTPQPLVTGQWFFLLLLGVAWAWYLVAMRWETPWRETAARWFAFLILFLAALMTFSFVTGWAVPWWPASEQSGFFPNRNQTSNVLGLGGILIYALALQGHEERRRFWWLWLQSLPLVCWALIQNYSRSGIILFFLGTLAVHLFWWRIAADRRRPVFAMGGLLLLLVLFLVVGGATLARFRGTPDLGLLEEGDLRVAIYRDALALWGQISPLGLGLGNFRPIFSINRHYSVSLSEVAHPESDWMWAALDLGWVGLACVVALFVWWLRRCLPFAPGTGRVLRFGALVCGCAFVLHGLADVSGHRAGALWPALLLASLALAPRVYPATSRFLPWLSRFLGLVLVAVGIWWTGLAPGRLPPTTATAAGLKAKAEAALVEQDGVEAIRLSEGALRITPLDWHLYFIRGAGRAAAGRPEEEVERDFEVARYLLPAWPNLYISQGTVWLTQGEVERALRVWQKGMERVPQGGIWIYEAIRGLAGDDPGLRDAWRELAGDDPARLVMFLGAARPTEFQIALGDLLLADPELARFDEAQLKKVLGFWFQKGNKLALAAAVADRERWERIGWGFRARALADYGDYRPAYEAVRARGNLPALPPVPGTVEELRVSYRLGGDVRVGLALARAQQAAGDLEGAGVTLATLPEGRAASPEVARLRGEVLAARGDWKGAWQAVARFAE